MKNKKPLFVVLALFLIGLIVWEVSARKSFLYAGTIEATEIDIAPRVASNISKVFVQEGDLVKIGEPLAKLSCEDVKLDAQLAQTDFNRITRLFRKGSATQEALDHTTNEYNQAMLRLNWCDIGSPMNATVLYRPRDPGDYVSVGETILTLADLNSVYAYVYVPQPMLAKLSLGEKATGYLPELNRRAFPGHIEFIRPEAEFTPKNVQTEKERSRLVFGIKVAFDNPQGILKPGMPIEVRLGL